MRMPKQMLSDTGTAEAMIKRNYRELIRKYSKKSHVWQGPFEVQFFDQDMDNVVRNLVTIRTTGNLYKAPRIAVKSLHDRNRSHLDRKYLRTHSRKYLSLPKGGVKLDA